jgi:hypothetical protein
MRVRDFYGIPSPQPSPKWGEGARDCAFCLLFWVASFSCPLVIKIWGELDYSDAAIDGCFHFNRSIRLCHRQSNSLANSIFSELAFKG